MFCMLHIDQLADFHEEREKTMRSTYLKVDWTPPTPYLASLFPLLDGEKALAGCYKHLIIFHTSNRNINSSMWEFIIWAWNTKVSIRSRDILESTKWAFLYRHNRGIPIKTGDSKKEKNSWKRQQAYVMKKETNPHPHPGNYSLTFSQAVSSKTLNNEKLIDIIWHLPHRKSHKALLDKAFQTKFHFHQYHLALHLIHPWGNSTHDRNTTNINSWNHC